MDTNLIRLPATRILPYKKYSAEINMAIDEYFLMHAKIPILRFYGWKFPTLSFGKSNSKLSAIDLEYCHKRDFSGVRRITGGKTVLHHQELTYAFIVSSHSFPPKILETYKIISNILQQSFSDFGLVTDMKKEKVQDSNTSNCFKEISSYELTVRGKKLVGSAQNRKNHRILQHGSILLKIDWDLWHKVWRIPSSSSILRNRITSFFDETQSLPEAVKMSLSIIKSFEKTFSTHCKVEPITEGEDCNIQELSPKYSWQEFKKAR